MSTIRARALALLLVMLIVAPAAARDPDGIAITPESERAAIILKAELLPTPPSYRTSYRIGLQKYDPAEQRLTGGPYGGNYIFQARRSRFVDGYMILEVEPGTYAFRDLSRQDLWALCFNDGSLQFTVRPGEVVYLGEIDARSHVAELERLAVMTGRISARSGEPVHFFDGVSPPAVKPIDEAALVAVTAMVRSRMPRTTVTPRAATYSPARFGTGRDLFGINRICGGYWQGRARPESEAE